MIPRIEKRREGSADQLLLTLREKAFLHHIGSIAFLGDFGADPHVILRACNRVGGILFYNRNAPAKAVINKITICPAGISDLREAIERIPSIGVSFFICQRVPVGVI